METRLNRAGVFTTEQMYALSCEDMVRVWGGINGARWWRRLRGHMVAEPPAIRRSVGHSYVLPPELRSLYGAGKVAVRLLERAAARMRTLGFYARGLSVYQRGPKPETWRRQIKFAPCQDTWTLIDTMHSLWEHPFPEPRQVSIVLWDLVAESNVVGSLFETDNHRREALRAMDSINARYGKKTITLAGGLTLLKEEQEKIAFGKVD